MKNLTHLPLLSAALCALCSLSPPASAQSTDWAAIPPSRDLIYHACHNTTFQCARLMLPLDWLDPRNNHTVTIPIVKLPAAVAEHHPSFGGAIITNPGGPGEPGTDFIFDLGHRLRSAADRPGRRHYEIISFDPRGIGSSEPLADCFPLGAQDRVVSSFESRANGATFQGEGAVPYGLAAQEVYGQRCKQADGQALGGGIFAYMGTASVARDIVELVDKVAAARAADKDRERTELRRRRDAGVNRVQYWGFSYGTVLGNVLASMFPGRIGRMVLDGVVDAEDFVAGPGYSRSLIDTEEMVDEFMRGCFAAGPSRCALARDAASATAIQSRFKKWFDGLTHSPLVASVQKDVFVLTRAEVGRLMLYMLYKPAQTFRDLATLLEQGMSGNHTALATRMLEMNILSRPSAGCSAEGGTAGLDGRNGVVCGDGSDVSTRSTAWWSAYFRDMLDMSPIAGPYWSTIRFTCARWPFEQKWAFKGPFGTPRYDPGLVPGKPAAPVLFVSNRLDPVTPLAGARQMARRYPGAGLVVQENLGHCALVTGESECVDGYVAEYFDTGRVPTEARCEVRCGPWGGCE